MFVRESGRSGWAVLAAGAMVASILAVGTAPAAAQGDQQRADAPATWRACLGEAMASNDFTDVDMRSAHYDSINCLAYYGITTGKTADTFDPQGNVTRSQMALFLARAADKANITIAAAGDQGFVDLNSDDTERYDAINSLTAAGIMFGAAQSAYDPPSTTHFAPSANVTRWEMAMFLFAFLDHALESVLVDTFDYAIDGDPPTGHVKLNSLDGETGDRPNDYFLDARRNTPSHIDDRISAIYELGVTFGTNGKVGPEGVFDPNGLVTRAQMASFIMRTLGHTNLRPEGLTAQSTLSDTQVSVRDANFDPIENSRTEVFTTNYPNDAFNRYGQCISRFVNQQHPSILLCRIDASDTRTEADGNALWEGVGLRDSNPLVLGCFTLAGATRGGSADYSVYAWSSDLGDELDEDSERVKSVAANSLESANKADSAVLSGGTRVYAKMGSTVTYTIQLMYTDARGNKHPVAPTPGINYDVDVTVETHIQTAGEGDLATITETDPDLRRAAIRALDLATADDFQPNIVDRSNGDTRVTTTHRPDASGKITIPVSVRDPRRATGGDDSDALVIVKVVNNYYNDSGFGVDDASVKITGQRWSPNTGDGSTTTWVAGDTGVRFSDDVSEPNSIVTASAGWRFTTDGRNSIGVTVLDQYGERYTTGDLRIRATEAATPDDFNTVYEDPATPGTTDNSSTVFNVNTSGRRSVAYAHGRSGSELQAVTLDLVRAANDYAAATASAALSTWIAQSTPATISELVNVVWAGQGNLGQIPTATPERRARTLSAGGSGYLVVTPDDLGTTASPTTGYSAYAYGPDDRFVVEGTVVTMAQFEAVLANYNLPTGHADKVITSATLSWVGYNIRRPQDGASWTLDLTCA